jgi:long-chain acyl-CoA synthetase
MYTSGSTGVPKGVMLSHKNLVSGLQSLSSITKFEPGKDRYIGYLPLAHVLELLAETCCLVNGVKIGYSSPLTLTNKSTKVASGSKGDANVLQPTLICAVPLILERIYKSIEDTMKRQGWFAEELFHYLVRYKKKWQDRGFDTPLLNKTLFRKIRYFLGGRVRLMLSGGAPLSPETHALTRTCLCVPLLQGYGLTETTSSATVMAVRDRSTGRAGAPLVGVDIKLVDWKEGDYLVNDKPNPRGEIHVGGDNVAVGYFRNQEATESEFYEENGKRWFRTGDIGEFDQDGVLRIIDRKKDLVKLQAGEYVSYGKVESVLKTAPVVENICAYGDPSRNFIVAIVVPDKTKLNSLEAAKGMDSDAAVSCAFVVEEIIRQVKEHGSKNGLKKFEIPSRIMVVNDEWTPETGLVTAAFKIRRKFVYAKYKTNLDALYS